MAGMGPAPKQPDQRARRNATVAMTILPAEGRTGRTPAWPLPEDIQTIAEIKLLKARIPELADAHDEATGRERSKLARQLLSARRALAVLEEKAKASKKLERQLWGELWKTPQAVEWERLTWTRTVGQYVRWKIAAELGDLDASKEARQLEDRLGLNPLALLRLRWQIGDRGAAGRIWTPEPEGRRSGSGSGARARHRGLRVVASGE